MIICEVKGEFIQLNQFLKLENLAMSGGDARSRIENGEVKVNGEVTNVIRKKLRTGDTVEIDGTVYQIKAEE
ncbi:MAG: RNA-binding S4 domain-containing protein [Firmicutes bacterium]|jgi:ribosome-associated protein|nr:RNA-binding S4 domain-containing protein [Bacillota bacterium]